MGTITTLAVAKLMVKLGIALSTSIGIGWMINTFNKKTYKKGGEFNVSDDDTTTTFRRR